MPTIGGSFTVPISSYAPGSISVYDWAKCRVLVNKQVIDPVYQMSCTRSADIMAGQASIQFLDPTKSLYNIISPGDELEIFLFYCYRIRPYEQSPLVYANKVWGGFVDSRNFDVDNRILLTVKGKEYSNNLILNTTYATVQANKNSFTSVEPGDAIKALMTNYQVDFTTDNVLTGTTSRLTADYLNKSLFDAIKSICDQFNYVFYVDLNKDLNVRQLSQVVNTPPTDYLVYGENMNSIKAEDNKELLCNDIIVYGKTSGVVSNGNVAIQDATSITAYGVHSKRIVISNLTTNTDCNNYANAYVAAYKNPIQQYKTVSRLVAFSDPLMYIPVVSDPSAISGSYQMREISHYFEKASIRTEMTLSNKITDLSIALGQLISRMQAVENKAFA